MERNEELRDGQSPRAPESVEAGLRPSDASVTASDAVVRDDSLLGERHADGVADRTERAAGAVRQTTDRAVSSAKAHGVVDHDDLPSVGDQVGEAAGGISGVLAGAAIGSIGGPIGTVIGGIAGAIGGWWTGRAISEAAANFTHSDDAHYRNAYEGSDAKLADRSYDDVRPAYQLGHIASRNPDYSGREFEAVESDLERGWSSTADRASGEWRQVRAFARDAFVRGSSKDAPRKEGRQDEGATDKLY